MLGVRQRLWKRVRSPLVIVGTTLFCASALFTLITFGSHVQPVRGALREHQPIEVHGEPYVSSNECRSCHPSEYASWADTYHRRMTQQTAATTVLGKFDGVKLGDEPSFTLGHDAGHGYYVDVSSPGAAVERHNIPIVTGSHHMQIYWYESNQDRSLTQLPFVFLKRDQRWVPRSAIFIEPPDAKHAAGEGRWNVSCIACHATLGRPRADAHGKLDTQVAEFGIACEACHGPGAEHIARYRSPWARYTRHFSAAGDDLIVQPKRLTHERSSYVCGQCHSTWLFNDQTSAREWNEHGTSYRPGAKDLGSGWLVQPSRAAVDPRIGRYVRFDPDTVASQFWNDGMTRVSGREFNGLADSPCYVRGELSCTSCHAMHQHVDDSRPRAQWKNAQLAADMDSDKACLQCHDSYARAQEQHTRHAAGSEGSRCYNCHMPYTTYGLLKALRSHRIDSPSVDATLKAGRPNACNLCHLDKTLAWTAEQLQERFGKASSVVEGDLADSSVALVLALRGDAAQRALIAWALSWPPARAASRPPFAAALLAQLLDDPYTAVRYIAEHSLRELGVDTQALSYDFVTSPSLREPVAQGIGQLIQPERSADERAAEHALFDRFLRARDDRPVQLLE